LIVGPRGHLFAADLVGAWDGGWVALIEDGIDAPPTMVNGDGVSGGDAAE